MPKEQSTTTRRLLVVSLPPPVYNVVKRILVALAIVFFVVAGLVVWAMKTGRAADMVKDRVVNALRQECGVEPRFESIRVGLFPPEIQLNKLFLQRQGAPVVGVDEAVVGLKVFPLLYGRIQLERARLVRPTAKLHVANGQLQDVPNCLRPKPTETRAPKAPTSVVTIGVSDLEIERAQIALEVDDNASVDVGGLDVSLKPAWQGGFVLEVRVSTVAVSLFGKRVVVDSAEVRALIAGQLISPRAISVERLEVVSGPVSLGASGNIDLVGPVFDGEVRASGPLSIIETFVENPPPVSGTASFVVKVAGPPSGLSVVGHATLDHARVDRYGAGDRLEADFHASQEGLRISALDVRVGEGRVTGNFHLSLAEKMPFSGRIQVDRLSLGRVLDAAGVPGAWVDDAQTGVISVEGQARDPVRVGGNLDIDVTDFSVFDRAFDRIVDADKSNRFLAIPRVEVRGAWVGDAEGFTLKGVKISAGTTTGTATARIHFSNERGARIVASFDAFDFADVGSIAGLSMRGRGRIDATIEGSYLALGARGHATLLGTQVGGIPFGDTDVDAIWRDDTVLALENIRARLMQSRYEANACVDFAQRRKCPGAERHPSVKALRGPILFAEGQVVEGRVEDILIPFRASAESWGHPRGRFLAKGELFGPASTLSGTIDAVMREVTILDERFEQARVAMVLEGGAIRLDDVELQKREAKITVRGQLDPASGALALVARTHGLTLQSIDAVHGSTTRLEGRLDVALDVRGSWLHPVGSVTATLSHAVAGALNLGGGTLHGRIDGRTVHTTATLLGDSIRLSADVGLKQNLPYSADIALSNFALFDIAGQLQDNLQMGGRLDADLKLRGALAELRDLSGAIAMKRGNLALGSTLNLELAGPARIRVENGVLRTRRIAIAGPGTKLSASGRLGARLIDVQLDGAVDLSLVSELFAPVERSGGVLTLNARIHKEAGDVELFGTGQIERGLLEWKNVPGRFFDLHGALTFSQSAVLLDRLEGRWADGRVNATGRLVLEGSRPAFLSIDAELMGPRPSFIHPKFDMNGTVHGKIALEGRPEHLVMRGNLDVSRSTFVPKFDWRSLVTDSARRVASGVYDPANEILFFDVALRIDAADPLRLRNESATADLVGDVVLAGTNQRPGMTGALLVNRGQVAFMGREYVVESGVIEFRDENRFYPAYDLGLTARACDADISLGLSGTLDHVETTYSSKPEMDATNIVSCLARGLKVKDIENLSRGTQSAIAVGLAGETLWSLSGVDTEVKRVFSIDQFELTSEYSTRERVYEPRFRVGKEIGDGRLRLEYSSSLVKNDDQRAALRYRITPKLTLQYSWASSRDVTIGDHGLDLKYRWEW